MCELTLLVHVMDTESTPPPICGCVLAVVLVGTATGSESACAELRFNTHVSHTHTARTGNVLYLCFSADASQGPGGARLKVFPLSVDIR